MNTFDKNYCSTEGGKIVRTGSRSIARRRQLFMKKKDAHRAHLKPKRLNMVNASCLNLVSKWRHLKLGMLTTLPFIQRIIVDSTGLPFVISLVQN